MCAPRSDRKSRCHVDRRCLRRGSEFRSACPSDAPPVATLPAGRSRKWRPNRSAKVTRNPSARSTSGYPSAFSNPSTPVWRSRSRGLRERPPEFTNDPQRAWREDSRLEKRVEFAHSSRRPSSRRTAMPPPRRSEGRARRRCLVIRGPHGFVERIHHDRNERRACWASTIRGRSPSATSAIARVRSSIVCSVAAVGSLPVVGTDIVAITSG